MRIALRIFSYYRRYITPMVVAAVALLFGALIELVIPNFTRFVVDCGLRVAVGANEAGNRGCPSSFNFGGFHVGFSDPITLITSVVLTMLGLTILRSIFQFLQGYFGEYGSQGIAYDLRRQIYEHLQQLSFSWHDRAQ